MIIKELENYHSEIKTGTDLMQLFKQRLHKRVLHRLNQIYKVRIANALDYQW